MSLTWPPIPPEGWCSRNRVLGRQNRFSRSAAMKINAPALATQPVPMQRTVGRMNLIMSCTMSPDSTWPPGEEM